MAAVSHSARSGASLPALRFLSGFNWIAQSLAARRQRHQQMRELNAFSDRELRDVGLSRSDFIAIEEGVYRRD